MSANTLQETAPAAIRMKRISTCGLALNLLGRCGGCRVKRGVILSYRDGRMEHQK
ncbi:hypothetical protein Plhal304r1_c003g0013851 [Plasmopara halstedii]